MPNKYAALHFGPEESTLWHTFLTAMTGLQIITLSKEQIEEETKIFMSEKVGADTRLVLHNDKEVADFECVMKIWFPKKEYQITDTPDDESFERWLKTKNKFASSDTREEVHEV